MPRYQGELTGRQADRDREGRRHSEELALGMVVVNMILFFCVNRRGGHQPAYL